MARKRDYKKEYVRRQEIARMKGYVSYWDYRLHGHGRRPSEAPQVRGSLRDKITGKRGTPRRLQDRLGEGNVEMINAVTTRYGKNPEVELLVTLDTGDTEEYKLTGRRAIQRFYDDYEDIPEDDRPPLIGEGYVEKALA